MVGEMLIFFSTLEPEIKIQLVDLFNQRLKNDPSGLVSTDEAWDSVVVILLQKIADATRPKNFRGIAIIPVLQKVYLKCLGWWFERHEGWTTE